MCGNNCSLQGVAQVTVLSFYSKYVAIGQCCLYMYVMGQSGDYVFRVVWATVCGSRSPSSLSCHCGKLPPDWWRSPAVTGVMIQSCVYSPVEQTCCVYEIKLLYVHPSEYPETDLYLVLLF